LFYLAGERHFTDGTLVYWGIGVVGHYLLGALLHCWSVQATSPIHWQLVWLLLVLCMQHMLYVMCFCA